MEPVGGNHQFRTRIVVAIRNRFSAKAGKDNTVDGADACTCQHDDGKLGRHRHVNADHISFAYTQ